MHCTKFSRRLFMLQRSGQYKTLPHLPIPGYIKKPFYYPSKGKCKYSSAFDDIVQCHSPENIEKMRKACKVAAGALQAGLDAVKPGVTTEKIDQAVHNYIISQEAYPSGVYFMGFPKSVCTSVNEIACHGVPNLRPLEEGDILNIDVTAYLSGFFGDTSDMAVAGSYLEEKAEKLVNCTREAVWLAIKECKPGKPIRIIGEIIEDYVSSKGFTVCKEFIGHGIGANMHQPPPIIHNKNDTEIIMKPGMTFTIEPIIMENPNYSLEIWQDGWTIADKTGGLSAQYEHTVLITEDYPEVLTDRSKIL